MTLFIIIPAYNEEKIIAETAKGVKKFCENIIVIDDGSSDATGREAEQAGAFVLRHIVNRGQGAALRTGINYALQSGAEIIVTYDADGQFEASEIEKIIAPVISGEADVVLGSRFTKQVPSLGEKIGQKVPSLGEGGAGRIYNIRENPLLIRENRVPFFKKILLKSATLFTRAVTGLNLTDTHNGFRAFSRVAAEKIKIRQDRMAHSSEIIHEIARLNLKYKEVPVTVNYTDYSRRKGQKLSGAWRILFDLIFR